MSNYEVSVTDYRRCLRAGKCDRPEDGVLLLQEHPETYLTTSARECNLDRSDRQDHPMNCLTRANAEDYCRFIGGRLPNAAEWTMAASSGGVRSPHPWGRSAPSRRRLNACAEECYAGFGNKEDAPLGYNDGYVATAPVGSFPAGRTVQGLYNMAGNVMEWTIDGYRGAGYHYGDPRKITVCQGAIWPSGGEQRDSTLGFRCVHDPT